MGALGKVFTVFYLKDPGYVHADVFGWLPLMEPAVELSSKDNV